MKPAEAKNYLKQHDVKYVLAQFVDVHGAAKAKSVPVEHYDTVISDGAGFAGFALAGMGMKPNADGDFMAVGDPTTLSVCLGSRAMHAWPRMVTCMVNPGLIARALY